MIIERLKILIMLKCWCEILYYKVLCV